jgi:hypothetical protein
MAVAVTEAEGLAEAVAEAVAAADADSNPALKSNSKLWERPWPLLQVLGERERTPAEKMEGRALCPPFCRQRFCLDVALLNSKSGPGRDKTVYGKVGAAQQVAPYSYHVTWKDE